MKKPLTNYAYIDGANLHKGVSGLGWKLDYVRFRVWLKEKYGVVRAYLFIGLIPSNTQLYKYLQEAGFILVYKEVVYDSKGKPKGNCDADLVLQVVCDTYEGKYTEAVIVTSDGDYAGLVRFLSDRKKTVTLISPARQKQCSLLLKRTEAPIVYLIDKQTLLERRVNFGKEKPPVET